MKQDDYDNAGQALQRQHDNSPAKAMERHRDFFEARLKNIEQWVKGGIDPRALVRFLLHDMQTNQKLRECTRESLYLGLLACAVTALEPGPLKGHAFLIPFKNVATFVPGWKGLVVQARRSREIVGITANVVHEADEFDLDTGTANRIVHKPFIVYSASAQRDRGPVVGAYAWAQTRSGHMELEWMERDDLNKLKRIATARGKSPAWDEWPTQMMRKAPLRRLCKRLPLGHDYFVALALEQAHDEGRDQKTVLDLETDGAASAVADAKVPRMTDEEKAAIAAEEAKLAESAP